MLVIKIGGSLRDCDTLLRDIARCAEPVVLVHGASRELDVLSTQLGRPPRTVTSERGAVSRYTDAATMDDFLMAYCGKVNTRIVARLRALGVDAVGLSGVDGGIATGRRRDALRIREDGRVRVLRGDHAGSLDRVDPSLLQLLLDAGRTPVLCPPALDVAEGVPINVDGDRLAMELAVALGARCLLIFSDRPGLLADADDETSVVPRLRAEEIDAAAVGAARGRFRVKLRAAGAALERGMDAVCIADGRRDHPLADALEGAGTWITR